MSVKKYNLEEPWGKCCFEDNQEKKKKAASKQEQNELHNRLRCLHGLRKQSPSEPRRITARAEAKAQKLSANSNILSRDILDTKGTGWGELSLS